MIIRKFRNHNSTFGIVETLFMATKEYSIHENIKKTHIN